MKIAELQKRLEAQDEILFRGNCHDCGEPVEVRCFINQEGKLVIEEGAVYNPRDGATAEEKIFLKCDECFKKDPILRNWQDCTVWSRVVGYLRPTVGWNRGKREEFKQRKVFNFTAEKSPS